MQTLKLTLSLALCSLGSLALIATSGCTKKADNTSSNPPASEQAPAENSKAPSAEETITGKIELAPLLERTPIKPSAAIYLIARPAGRENGPPVAVKRFTPPFQFPISFTLSKADAMMPNMPFQGTMDITVRLAQSGSAMPAASGDFEGIVENGPIPVGQKNIIIRLSKVRQ